MRLKIDLTGQKFHRLLVVEEAGRNARGKILWRCKCECNKEIIAVGSNLRSKNTQSCGCRRKKNLRGKTFHRLLVVEEAGRSATGKVLWKCRCECGNETLVQSGHLRNGTTKSCGCLNREIAGKMCRKENSPRGENHPCWKA